MYNTDSGPHVYTDAYHARDMMKMTFSKTFGSIERVNPNDHLIFIELVWEFEEVPVWFCSHLAIDLF